MAQLGPAFAPAAVITLQELGLGAFPTSSMGKIQKSQLKELARLYIEKQDEEASGSFKSIESALVRIWARLLGQPEDSISPTMSVHNLADSITLMRFRAKVQRELGTDISLQELSDYGEIRAQARLIDHREKTEKPVAATEPLRTGPPQASDMAHTGGDSQKVAATKAAAESTLKLLGLTWGDDVEDVAPITDWGQFLARRLRPQSWNHRYAWVTKSADVGRLRQALEACLSNHPMLRTAIILDGVTPFHMVVRPSPRWFKLVIRDGFEVETPKDLRTLNLNTDIDHAAAPGPLFKLTIANVRSTGSAGITCNAQHSAYDALSMPLFHEDLDKLLTDGVNALLPQRTPFKHFADTYHLHRSSLPAQTAIAHHVRHLKGLSTHPSSLWPPQRSPGWFKGSSNSFIHPDGTPSRPGERTPLTETSEMDGLIGIDRSVSLPSLNTLKSEHGISPAVVAITAFAILNTRITGQRTAIFANYDAGRSWPFLSPWLSAHLPNAMDIPGPTWQGVVNKVTIDPHESVLQLLQRMQTLQSEQTLNAHAPLFAIKAQLGEKDGEVFEDALRRQVFNWLPGMGQEQGGGGLRSVQVQSRADTGFSWNCGVVGGGEELRTQATWDGCQLSKPAVEDVLDRWMAILQFLTDPARLGEEVRGLETWEG